MKFERHLKPKESLGIGIKTTTDRKIQRLLDTHSNMWDPPVVIERIEITPEYRLSIHFSFTSDKNSFYNIADQYFRKVLREANLNFLLAETGQYKTFEKSSWGRVIEYKINKEYWAAFEVGRTYRIDEV
ncbi:MAG: hypothetical protein HC831_02175 [Chloroflexia bacterium]|nr:hypothetical protein [Chloroflexia bacterium]